MLGNPMERVVRPAIWQGQMKDHVFVVGHGRLLTPQQCVYRVHTTGWCLLSKLHQVQTCRPNTDNATVTRPAMLVL